MNTNNQIPHNTLKYAREHNWTAKQLAETFTPSISEESAEKLLMRTAEIRNVATNGAFEVYVPSRTVG